MDRNPGDSLRRLRQLGLGGAPDDVRGWVEELPPDPGADAPGPRGRHASDAAAQDGPDGAAPRWRLTGVPAGVALVLLVLAVALVVGLGRGGTEAEVLVGPGSVTATPTVPGGAGHHPTGDADHVAAGVAGAPSPPAVPVPVADPAPRPPADSSSGPLLVHVDGAVQRPGVVSVPGGSRVSDAVAAAGGVTDEADTRLVNLARPLQDGELVVVPRPGEQPDVGTPEGAAAGAAAAGEGAEAVSRPGGPGEGDGAGAVVDINRAGVDELDVLPGVGPVLAQRIVDHREEVGPFASVDDLTAVSGIGPAVLDRVRDQVTV